MLTLTFKQPHWNSTDPSPSKEADLRLERVSEVKVKGDRLFILMPTTHDAIRAGQFLALDNTQQTDNMLEVASIDGRWYVGFKFFTDFEVHLCDSLSDQKSHLRGYQTP